MHTLIDHYKIMGHSKNTKSIENKWQRSLDYIWGVIQKYQEWIFNFF